MNRNSLNAETNNAMGVAAIQFSDGNPEVEQGGTSGNGGFGDGIGNGLTGRIS